MKFIAVRKGFFTGTNRLLIKFALLIMYLAVLSYGLFFAEGFGRDAAHVSYNIEPFCEIKRYIIYADKLGWEIVALNLLGNIFVFLPFGFLVPSLWPSDDKRHPIALLLLTMLFSVMVELLQFVTGVGAADVDDVILNTIGGCLGYQIYAAWRHIRYGEMNVTKMEVER